VFPATGVAAGAVRKEADPKTGLAERSSTRPAPPATPKRRPGKDKKRRRDEERFGAPELARRDKRRGRGPRSGKPPGR
jgi:hypothetical protein